MAVLHQVHLAYQGFRQAEDRYTMSKMLDSINERLNALTLAEEKAGTGNTFTVIKSKTNALVTKMRKILAYAELQGAMSRLINTIGLDILPERVEGASVAEVSNSLRDAVQGVEVVLAYPGNSGVSTPEK